MGNVVREAVGSGDVLGTGDGPHFGAVQRHLGGSDKTIFTTEDDERSAGADDGFRIIVPERRNGPIVGRHAPHRQMASRSRWQARSNCREERNWFK